jgi:hypothetical protein
MFQNFSKKKHMNLLYFRWVSMSVFLKLAIWLNEIFRYVKFIGEIKLANVTYRSTEYDFFLFFKIKVIFQGKGAGLIMSPKIIVSFSATLFR